MTKLENRVLFDYFTISFKELSADSVLSLVCELFSNDIFVEDNFIYNNNSVMTAYGTSYKLCDTPYVSINWNKEHSEFGVSLNITGQGCNYLTESDIKNFFNYLYSKNINFKITRCDLAFDDYNNILPYDLMIDYLRTYLVNDTGISSYTKCTSVKTYENGFDKGASFNCMFGSRSSERSFRLYDKRIEQKIKTVDCPTWKRWELQARGNYAMKIIDYYVNSDAKLSHIFADFAYQMIKFLDKKDKVYASRRTAKTAQWYLDLLEAIKNVDYKGQVTFDDSVELCRTVHKNVYLANSCFNVAKYPYVKYKFKNECLNTLDIFQLLVNSMNHFKRQYGRFLALLDVVEPSFLRDIIDDSYIEIFKNKKYELILKNYDKLVEA